MTTYNEKVRTAALRDLPAIARLSCLGIWRQGWVSGFYIGVHPESLYHCDESQDHVLRFGFVLYGQTACLVQSPVSPHMHFTVVVIEAAAAVVQWANLDAKNCLTVALFRQPMQTTLAWPCIEKSLDFAYITPYNHTSTFRWSYWGKSDRFICHWRKKWIRSYFQKHKFWMDCILAELSIQCLWAYSRELLICAILVRAWAWHCSAQALLGYDSAAHAKLCYLGRTDAIPCSTRCYLRSKTECIVGNASLGQLGGPAARTSRNHVPFSAKP